MVSYYTLRVHCSLMCVDHVVSRAQCVRRVFTRIVTMTTIAQTPCWNAGTALANVVQPTLRTTIRAVSIHRRAIALDPPPPFYSHYFYLKPHVLAAVYLMTPLLPPPPTDAHLRSHPRACGYVVRTLKLL